ncbi:MAG TPA: hypothetical protein VGB38_09580 [bacterium]
MNPFHHRGFSVLLWISLFLLAKSHAQPLNADRVGLYAGWGGCTVRDELMTPLAYSSGFASLKVVYYGATTHDRHFIEYGFHSERLESGTGHWIKNVSHGFEYSYHRRIRFLSRGLTRVHLGCSSINTIITRQGFFSLKTYGTGSNEYTAGETLFTVNVSVLVERTFGSRHTARAQTSLPILAYIVRPPYSISENWRFRDGEFRFMRRYFFNKTKIGFETPLGPHFSLICSCTLVTYSVKDPFKVVSFTNEIGAEILFHL